MLRVNPLSNRSILVPALLLVAVAGTAIPGAALADSKPLGVISSDRIFQEYEAAQDIQEQFNKFLQELDAEIKEKERELASAQEEIERQQLLLGEAALQAKVQEFEAMRADYLEFRRNAEERAYEKNQELMKPITDQVTTIAERIGREEGFGLIVDASTLSVIYLDDSVDLTDRVLEALVRGTD